GLAGKLRGGLGGLLGGGGQPRPGGAAPAPGAPAVPGAPPPAAAAPPPGAGPAPRGGGGQLLKLTLKPEKGDKLEVPYHPAEYTVQKSTPWKHHTITGLDAPTLEFTAGEPTRITFD